MIYDLDLWLLIEYRDNMWRMKIDHKGNPAVKITIKKAKNTLKAAMRMARAPAKMTIIPLYTDCTDVSHSLDELAEEYKHMWEIK